MDGFTNPWNPDETLKPVAVPEPTRQPTEAEWRTEYTRLYGVAEEAKQAAAAQQRTAATQQQATAAAQQEASRLAAEIAQMRAQAATQAQTTATQVPTTASSAAPAPSMISTRTPDLDYIRRQQLKAIQVPMLEGKLDLQLVAEFVRKVELMATNLGMAPHDTTDHSNQTIQMAVGWFSAPVMTWFREVVLRDDHEETYEHCIITGFPFSWADLCLLLRHRYSPANAEEALWLELEHLKRLAYPSIHHFHQAFMDKARLLGLHRESEVRGSRLYAIYKGHMKKDEESTLRAVMMVMSHSGQSVTLDQAMRVAEDTELELPVRSTT